MAEGDLVYSRVWTSIEDFPTIELTKTWESQDDFPTIEVDEETVRADMQFLFNEIADYINGTLKSFIADFGGSFVTFDGLTEEEKDEIQGPRGVTYTPHVNDGVLWWTNDGGLPNPDPVQISQVSETTIVQELYSSYGDVADLTVDSLRTDYRRAWRYLQGDTSPLDYLRIHDEEIEFVSGETTGEQTEQLVIDGDAFYWTDATKTQMTKTVTSWPVIVYVYTEYVKAAFRFAEVLHNGAYVKVPVLKLGVGDQLGHNYALIYKDPDGLKIAFEDERGNVIGMTCDRSGYTDLAGLRKPMEIDFSGWGDGTQDGSFSETLDGNVVNSFSVEFDAQGRPVLFTDGDGHETAVTW